MTLLTERPETSSSTTETTLKAATATLSLTPQCAAAAT